MSVRIIHGDALEVLRTLPDASVDAVVTDPPYGLGEEPDALAMLRDGRLVGRQTVPGFQVRLAPVPGQAKVYVATSAGLWGPP